MFRAFLRKVVPEPCGCGRPATEGGYFCDRCRAAVTNPDHPYDEFAQQHALTAKLNSLTTKECNRTPVLGLPSRLLQ